MVLVQIYRNRSARKRKSKHRPRNDPDLYRDGFVPLVQTGDVARANGVITTYTALYNKKGLAQSRLWHKGTLCITIAANIADSAILGFDACFPDSIVGFYQLNPFQILDILSSSQELLRPILKILLHQLLRKILI
jgi:hypothetical protein